MHIKTYECKRFAGLRDINLDFEKGLNVILGSNESGKSTIIEGIHSTLFKDTKVGNRSKSDIDFTFRFMPKPTGDFIDGKLIIALDEGECEIYKEWGSNENIHFIGLDGNIIKDKKSIKKEIAGLLSFGESTYSNIVFAKQRDIKRAIDNIISNSEITSEINDLLRQTMMELDGISVDNIEVNIDKEIEDLYKRWDRDKNYPENNKGINDPYKVGLGKIIECYYNKENLKIKMERAEKTEKRFESICNEIKALKDKRDKTNTEKNDLEKIEEDVNIRAVLDAEILATNKELEDLNVANKNWPITEMLIKQIDEKIEKLEVKGEKLLEEKEDLKKVEEKEIINKKLLKIENLEEKIKDKQAEICKLPNIRKDDISKLRSLKNVLGTLETTMRASKMIGILKKTGDKPLYVTRDLGESEALELDRSFEANGLINVSCDEFEFEIKTGEIDFEELADNHRRVEKEYEEMLKNLDIDSFKIAEANFDKVENLIDEKKDLDLKLELELEEMTKEDLESKLNELKDIRIFRGLHDIVEEEKKIKKEDIELSSEKMTKENTIKSWEEKYTDHDNLFEIVIDVKNRAKEKKEKKENLKPLPEEFETTKEFKDKLRCLRDESEDLNLEFESLSAEQYDAKSNLLDETYEELRREQSEVELLFDKNIKKGEKLLEIKRVFMKTKEELLSNPMNSLVDEFIRLLEIITDGSYKKGEIDEEFTLKLENENGEIPIELLSAGTYDSVALALRFSLIKHIFKDQGGYIVLDDCLVDLDPERKAQSVKLINDFAKDYQIIFTTCDPQTANMLGGNIIGI